MHTHEPTDLHKSLGAAIAGLPYSLTLDEIEHGSRFTSGTRFYLATPEVVRAVNSHAALVAALERARDHLIMSGVKSSDAPEALAQARAALAAAKGE